MIVNVNFFKADTGKWYAGGQVDVGAARLWHDDFSFVLASQQQILRTGALSSGDYITVVENIEGWDPLTEFCCHLFFARDFPTGL